LTFRQLTAPGLEAVRRYWRPFVLLQTIALLLVLGYYHVPVVAAACERLSVMKQNGGVLFVMIAAALAGAILPELAKAAVQGERTVDRVRVGAVLFAVVAFAINGVITDYQYRLLGVVVGEGVDAATIFTKVLADQFIMTPLYGIPYWALVFGWRNHGYNLRLTLGEIGPQWYARKVLALLIPCWAFWLPMVSLIYALPGPLQFCLFSLALAAWSLIMVFVASRK
jgi:hypothetical protein